MIRPFAISMAITLAAPVAAETQILSAPDAAAAVAAGEMILIDIRRPAEWQSTGVAAGAVALTMHDASFGPSLGALLAANQGKTIGLICATGGRTAYVAEVLAQNGVTDVVDVSEGMMGNRRGPGWLERGLPVVTAAEAEAAYQAIAPQ